MQRFDSRLESWKQDIRFGIRVLRKGRVSTISAVTILALGIGSATAVASLVNSIFDRKFPYVEADRIAIVWAKSLTDPRTTETPITGTEYRYWATRARSVSAMAAYSGLRSLDVSGDGFAERVRARFVSGELFSTLGVQLASGRSISVRDVNEQGPVTVISYEFWRERMGGRVDALGQTLMVDRRPHTVIGILPPEFEMPTGRPVSMLLPLAPSVMQAGTSRTVYAAARLADGVTAQAASAEFARIAAERDAELGKRGEWSANVAPIQQSGTGGAVKMVRTFRIGAIILVLTVCVNVALLLLAKLPGREQEIRLRLAMGATRGRVTRQLIVESVILAAAGGLAGMFVAVWGTKLLATSTYNVGFRVLPAIDGRALAIALGCVLTTGLLFGIAPAILATRGLRESLADAGGRATGQRRQDSLRQTLIGLDVALAAMLIVAAGLALHSLRYISSMDVGFDRSGVIGGQVTLDTAIYKSGTSRLAVAERMMERMRAIPGVQTSTFVTDAPLFGFETHHYVIAGKTPVTTPVGEFSSKSPYADLVAVDPGYFRALGIPIIRGTGFETASATDPVAIVDEEAVAQLFDGRDPVGEYVTVFESRNGLPNEIAPLPRRVIGVAKKVRWAITTGNDLHPQVFLPYAADAVNSFIVLVRTTRPSDAGAGLRAAVAAVDGTIPIYNVQSMDQLFDGWVASKRFSERMVSIIAAFAVVLSLIGIYSVLQVYVSARTRELGIRLALGARRSSIVTMVLGRAFVPVSIGTLVGLVVAYQGTRFIGSVMFGVQMKNAAYYAYALVFLALVTTLAALVPALRAARSDPNWALRQL